MDILFGTKYDMNDIENTDHYIIPILISTLGVYFTRFYWENTWFKNSCILLFSLIVIIFVAIYIYLFVKEYYKYKTVIDNFYIDQLSVPKNP
jgi:uncharacterized membrane protein YoaK (UPF0700 family)